MSRIEKTVHAGRTHYRMQGPWLHCDNHARGGPILCFKDSASACHYSHWLQSLPLKEQRRKAKETPFIVQ